MLYGYNFFTIDHNLEYLIPLDTFLKNILDTKQNSEFNLHAHEKLIIAINAWGHAQQLAKKLGWDGNIIKGPYVFFLPNATDRTISYGFIFKQYNKGKTFVISPIKLDYLEEIEDVIIDWASIEDLPLMDEA